MESANVNFDEYKEVHDAKPIKRPKEYKSFVYFYKGMPAEEEVANQVEIQQKKLVTVESQPINAKLVTRNKVRNKSGLLT